MKNILIFNFIFIVRITFSQTNPNEVWVKPYTTTDGKIIQGHWQTSPNSTNADNFGTKGNINPHTGKPGYIPKDNKQANSTSSEDIFDTPAQKKRDLDNSGRELMLKGQAEAELRKDREKINKKYGKDINGNFLPRYCISNANLRNGPGTGSDNFILIEMKANDIVDITPYNLGMPGAQDSENGWSRVYHRASKQTGYVKTIYLAIDQ